MNELDSAFVTSMLDVFPGCCVVESGTGSGCMTLSLARAVHPSGLVYTFEFNAVRAQKAKEEFERSAAYTSISSIFLHTMLLTSLLLFAVVHLDWELVTW